jgi:hypothetical protein
MHVSPALVLLFKTHQNMHVGQAPCDKTTATTNNAFASVPGVCKLLPITRWLKISIVYTEHSVFCDCSQFLAAALPLQAETF